MDPLEQLMANQPYQQGDFQRSGPQMQPTGVLESLMGAFSQKPWGVGDTINAALMAMPGARIPRGSSPVFAAEKGGGSGGAAPISQRVREAFNELSDGGQDSVRLHKLRERLSDIPRTELDRTLLDMQKSREANLMGLDNPRDIKAVGDAKLSSGSNDYHTLFLEPTVSAAPPQRASPKRAVPATSHPEVAPPSNYSNWLDNLLK